nr:putative glycosyltransferase [Anoectochilus roxburghii]
MKWCLVENEQKNLLFNPQNDILRHKQTNQIDPKFAGVPKHDEMFRLSPEMPPMDPTQLYWNCLSDSKANKTMFSYVVKNNRAVENAELIICNTVHELEKPALSYVPNILPVGPLLSGSRPNKPVGNFWQQDTSCIEWLDKKPIKSVIYAAFGSYTIFNQDQFQELALGLELTGRPFLWAVRPDLAGEDKSNLSDFIERVGDRGRIVGWCPQQQVLAHPSIACFISHCGWNSTLEGVMNGVPFLCWPYFCDQFFNQSYICDVWRVGMKMAADENGIYAKEQIRSKVEELVSDVGIKERSMALKEMTRRSLEEDGSSFKNFNDFIDLILGV